MGLSVVTDVTYSKLNIDTTKELTFDRATIDSGKDSYLRIKRFADVVLSILGLIVLFPLLIITALVVFFECPKANPIFAQERVGRDGRRFRFYKFRSMIPDAEDKLESLLALNEMEGHAFKIKDDPRITKVGKFLRKTSIDELPQLINILKGDMSIVGPRPPLPREVVNYNDYQLQRLYVTPGLTCYWQTTPNRNDMTFDEWLEMDLEYIEDRSLKTDFDIILGTFIAVFKMNGV